MAKTIPASFQKLKENLEISPLQEATVSTRQQNVRTALNDGLEVLSDFLTGSYKRQTLVSPLAEADIDIFAVLGSKHHHHFRETGGQAALLDEVKRVLKKQYPSTPDISRNGQAVTIRFSDFLVDVVPAFNRDGGGYLIPNSVSATWISTDPTKHVELWTAANRAHNGDFVPVVKMLKGWNKSHSSLFRSFHLELLAYKVFTNVNITDYPSGTRYFFDKARAWIGASVPDPVYNNDTASYLNSQTKREDALSKLQLAYERAVKAESFAREGKVQEAVDMWQKIFGSYFPAYG